MQEETATTTEKPLEVKTELLKTIKLPTAVLGVDVSADGQQIVAACLDGGVYIVDAETEETRLLEKHDSYASGVAQVPGTSVVISAGFDGVLKWHDIEEKRTIRSVKAHEFWSWQMAVSNDGSHVASVTGQYLTGGYKYEPAGETEGSVAVFNVQSGDRVCSLAHVPPVQSVAISPNGRYLAAANLMGEIRVWELPTGKLLANWTTQDLTSWGVIKSHCYIGGVYAMAFLGDGTELIVCGMGPMRDPMAGNGKQTWQKFAWTESPVRKVDEIHEGDHGRGLPETVSVHPSGRFFVMAGRLAQGKWNVAFFETGTGRMLQSMDAKNRITKAVFSGDGSKLFFGVAEGQPKKKENGVFPDFGRIAIFSVA
ncbi:MAG: WD40 repeat domain-containing protein [Verrucomicrobia bacterium]|nr:WD40 repeat domain-containing protein [Verrucomicrobiota bacterium]